MMGPSAHLCVTPSIAAASIPCSLNQRSRLVASSKHQILRGLRVLAYTCTHVAINTYRAWPPAQGEREGSAAAARKATGTAQPQPS
eukprot:363630-Chlamydomonas_euryale.AAC.6